MAKRIRVSDDAGTTYYTMPGSSGEMSYEAGEIDDTIFGQNFKSSQPGIVNWNITSNAYYKGFSGYVADLKKIGSSSTAMMDEAMSLVSGKTYQVTSSSKRILDRAVAVVVKDNTVAVDADDIENIDYLFGRVTFVSGYTVTGPVTITNAYFTTSSIAKGRSFTLTQTSDAVQTTTFDEAQTNGACHTFDYGLKTVALEVGGVFAASNDFQDLVAARTELIIEINPEGAGQSVARGYFKAMSQSQSGNVGDLEEETITFNLSVPAVDNMKRPFGWLHSSSTLTTAVQKALTAWEDETTLDVQYLPDGVISGGKQGTCIITEISLSGGLESMNEFSVTYQGTGAIADAS
jgi:hypothetical protein